jgi:peptidylprolyl isomerase
MTLENGALILADYTAKIKDTGLIIDTTRKDDAEKVGTFDPTRSYEPRLIAVGDGWMLKGVDEALANSNPNQTIDIELPPEKAFGVRNLNLVSRIPLRKFGEKAGELSIGSEIEVDNRTGIVRSLESGRAIIDFNHKYAGKTILYNLEIKEKLESKDSKIMSIVRRRLPIEKEKVKFEVVGDTEVKISIPSEYFLLDGLQIIKRGITTDLFKYASPLEKVTFVEEYENPSKKKEEPKLEEKKEEAKPVEEPLAKEEAKAQEGPKQEPKVAPKPAAKRKAKKAR